MSRQDNIPEANTQETGELDMQALKEQILEEARKEAADILAKAKKKAEAKTEKPANPENDWLNELVTVRLFKDGEKYKEDVFVSVNSKTWLIQRGVSVRIPRYVALQLEANQRQELFAMAQENAFAEQHLQSMRENNV